MLINLILSLFAIYLLAGIVIMLAVIFVVGHMIYEQKQRIHRSKL